jgi:hypothetical protein
MVLAGQLSSVATNDTDQIPSNPFASAPVEETAAHATIVSANHRRENGSFIVNP